MSLWTANWSRWVLKQLRVLGESQFDDLITAKDAQFDKSDSHVSINDPGVDPPFYSGIFTNDTFDSFLGCDILEAITAIFLTNYTNLIITPTEEYDLTAGVLEIDFGTFFEINETDNITSISTERNPQRQLVFLRFTNTATGTGLTHGNNIHLIGNNNFVYQPNGFILLLCSDGQWFEFFRAQH